LTYLVLDFLAFTKLFESDALDLGMVKEQITPLRFDEPKTPIRNNFLNLTLWHFCPPQKQTRIMGQWGFLLAKETIGPNNLKTAESHKTEMGTSEKATATQNAA